MKKDWNKTLLRIAFWLGVEIVLNFFQLDTLSDYSEFVFERKILLGRTEVVQAIIQSKQAINFKIDKTILNQRYLQQYAFKLGHFY